MSDREKDGTNVSVAFRSSLPRIACWCETALPGIVNRRRRDCRWCRRRLRLPVELVEKHQPTMLVTDVRMRPTSTDEAFGRPGGRGRRIRTPG